MPTTITDLIADAKRDLDAARKQGDDLKTDLAEATLNALLDRLDVMLVTGNE